MSFINFIGNFISGFAGNMAFNSPFFGGSFGSFGIYNMGSRCFGNTSYKPQTFKDSCFGTGHNFGVTTDQFNYSSFKYPIINSGFNTSKTYFSQSSYAGLNLYNLGGENKHKIKLSGPTFIKPENTTSSTSTTSSGTTSNNYITPSVLKPGTLKGRLAGKEGYIEQLCKKYGISDPKLIAAITEVETGFGTAGVGVSCNNPMSYRAAGDTGRKNKNGFGYFTTIDAGLEAGIRNLAKYKDWFKISSIDINHVDAIGAHYCDAAWASAVRKSYSKMA